MNLLTAIADTLSPRVVYRASMLLREHERNTWMAIEQFIPTVLAAAIQFTHTEEGAAAFLAMLDSGHLEGKIISELEGLLSNRIAAFAMLNIGERAAAKLMGDQMEPVILAVAGEIQIDESATREILALTTVVFLELLGRERAAKRLISYDPIVLLHHHRRKTARALPAEVARYIELYENPTEPETRPMPVRFAGLSLRFLKLLG
ncbi:MAG: DUF937 domain-containing protein [Acidobacteria bacterium]|nr:DUF937 domain-containing protein [Acidobacteriota bacterium]